MDGSSSEFLILDPAQIRLSVELGSILSWLLPGSARSIGYEVIG